MDKRAVNFITFNYNNCFVQTGNVSPFTDYRRVAIIL